MPQFKEKAIKQQPKLVNVGLFDYPVLMAADILLYQTNLVPVGEDQIQHLELCRDICKRFLGLHPSSSLILPEALISKQGARIMALDDATKKMSKSSPNDMARINLMDHPELIVKKIKQSKTDSNVISLMGRPECSSRKATNLFNLYKCFFR
jgi:tryptophanyl-tRNA synthetase